MLPVTIFCPVTPAYLARLDATQTKRAALGGLAGAVTQTFSRFGHQLSTPAAAAIQAVKTPFMRAPVPQPHLTATSQHTGHPLHLLAEHNGRADMLLGHTIAHHIEASRDQHPAVSGFNGFPEAADQQRHNAFLAENGDHHPLTQTSENQMLLSAMNSKTQSMLKNRARGVLGEVRDWHSNYGHLPGTPKVAMIFAPIKDEKPGLADAPQGFEPLDVIEKSAGVFSFMKRQVAASPLVEHFAPSVTDAANASLLTEAQQKTPATRTPVAAPEPAAPRLSGAAVMAERPPGTGRVVRRAPKTAEAAPVTATEARPTGYEVHPPLMRNPFAGTPDEGEYENGYNYAQALGHLALGRSTDGDIARWHKGSQPWKAGFGSGAESLGCGRVAQMLGKTAGLKQWMTRQPAEPNMHAAQGRGHTMANLSDGGFVPKPVADAYNIAMDIHHPKSEEASRAVARLNRIMPGTVSQLLEHGKPVTKNMFAPLPALPPAAH